jgi:hypothetical protein
VKAFVCLVVFAVTVGCGSVRDVPRADDRSSVGPGIHFDVTGSPHLSTNQVLAIAYSFASAHGVNTNRFRCRSIWFSDADPDRNFANKWILRFAPEPMSLHEDFFVDVGDLSGKAVLIRH